MGKTGKPYINWCFYLEHMRRSSINYIFLIFDGKVIDVFISLSERQFLNWGVSIASLPEVERQFLYAQWFCRADQATKRW